jgi:hypothetical protein
VLAIATVSLVNHTMVGANIFDEDAWLIDNKSGFRGKNGATINFHSHAALQSHKSSFQLPRALKLVFLTMKYSTISAGQLQPWAVLNDVELRGAKISSAIITKDGINKGGGLLSTTTHESEDVLLSISRDLVLSRTSSRLVLSTVSDVFITEIYLRLQGRLSFSFFSIK